MSYICSLTADCVKFSLITWVTFIFIVGCYNLTQVTISIVAVKTGKKERKSSMRFVV